MSLHCWTYGVVGAGKVGSNDRIGVDPNFLDVSEVQALLSLPVGALIARLILDAGITRLRVDKLARLAPRPIRPRERRIVVPMA